MEPIFLTVEDVVRLHEQAIRLYGGESGVRDAGLLESAVMAPQQTFGGEFLYGSVPKMAAALWHGLVQNHPFLDGNKRAGLRAADVFLARNGLDLVASSSQVEEWTLSVATGRLSREELAILIAPHLQPIP
jgi:death-on-curing protein